jgi:hypothetical protein
MVRWNDDLGDIIIGSIRWKSRHRDPQFPLRLFVFGIFFSGSLGVLNSTWRLRIWAEKVSIVVRHLQFSI